jgi:TonB family protein
VTLLRHRGADRSEIGTLAARALKLAEVECANNSLGSCGFVADWAAAAHDDARAVSFYLAQCRLERRTLDSTAQPASLSSCKKAAVGREMSAVLAATEPAPSRESEERLVPQRALEATRVAGITQIQPPDSERLAMRKRAQVAVFKLCLSKWGGVRSVSVLRASRHARWNRRLFEAMRGWRYSPFRIDGRPVPVCTSVTFIFKPTR